MTDDDQDRTARERLNDLAELYRVHRLTPQKQWYEARFEEFRQARNQARTIAASLLVVAAGAAAAASADLGGGRQWWAVAAAIVGAFATALTGYEAVYGFDRQARNYEQAIGMMSRLELTVDFDGATAPDEARAATVVAEIEDELLREVRGWATMSATRSLFPRWRLDGDDSAARMFPSTE